MQVKEEAPQRVHTVDKLNLLFKFIMRLPKSLN